MANLIQTLLDDIVRNHRTFLPGPACRRMEVLANLRRPILVGGLSDEEGLLLLSALPANATSLSLEPMDKGLSGSKVFLARYDVGGRRSKPFVMKVGGIDTIEREARALNDIVAPTILGIGLPVWRRGVNLGLVVQELASLSDRSTPESLKNRVRLTDAGPLLVLRILRDRLGPWYTPARLQHRDFVLGQLFEPYLTKGPTFGKSFPPAWDDLFTEVEDATGCSWETVRPSLEAAIASSSRLPETVVHGDLHTQNILVDERDECWPIDFAWTRGEASPLVDLAMLECSLKFLALPMRSELRPLLTVESELAKFNNPPPLGRVPYAVEANRVYRTIHTVREYGIYQLGIPISSYRAGLMLMTFALLTHPGLNTPYVLASLQILASFMME